MGLCGSSSVAPTVVPETKGWGLGVEVGGNASASSLSLASPSAATRFAKTIFFEVGGKPALKYNAGKLLQLPEYELASTRVVE